MNLKTWLPLCLALVLGLAAAMFAKNIMAKNKGPAASGNFVEIVVAKDAIGAGEALTAENTQMGKVGSDSVPDHSFRSMDELKDRVAQLQLVKGQPITNNMLAPDGQGTGLQVVIPAGMRAITIEVNEFSGVGGMIVPGCHIDLLATVPTELGGEMIARTVVQNVEVAAVGQRMIQQPEKKDDEPVVFRSVTLLATPSEAEAIELAANSGRPRLALRSGTDKELSVTAGVTTSNLRGNSAARKTDPAYASVKVIRGTTESIFRLDSDWIESTRLTTNNTTTNGKNQDGSSNDKTTPSNTTNGSKTNTTTTSTDTKALTGTDASPMNDD